MTVLKIQANFKSLLDNNSSKTKVFTVVLKTENLSSYAKIIFEQELRLSKKTFHFSIYDGGTNMIFYDIILG